MIQVLILIAALGQEPAAAPPDEGQIRKLVEGLGADYLEERDISRKALQKIGKPAEGALVDALGSADYRVRRACVQILTEIRSPRALPRVADLFRADDDGTVKDASMAYLVSMGKEAEDPLILCLESEKPEYRLLAVQTLSTFKSEKCAGKMAALYDREADPNIKGPAFECLKQIGKAAEPFLKGLLGSVDPVVRAGALQGLSQSQDPGVLGAVGALFVAETEPNVLNEAYTALRKAEARAEPHFLAGLGSVHEPVRLKAIDGLRDLKSEKAFDPVTALFEKESSDAVREHAADLLLKVFGARAEPAFLKGLASVAPQVKILSLRALGEIKSEKPLEQAAAIFRHERDREVHRAAFEYLKGQDLRAEKDLLFALEDEDKEIRRQAIATLGRARSAGAIPRLLDYLSDLDAETKTAARDALVLIGTPAVEAIQKAVAAGRIKVRMGEEILALHYQEEVERILDQLVTSEGMSGYYAGMFRDLEAFGKERALPVLLRMAREPGYEFRRRGARSGLNSFDLRMRELGILALGELGDARALEPLREALKSAPDGTGDGVHEETVVSLHRLGDPGPFNAFAAAKALEAERAFKGEFKADACEILFTLALTQGRLGLHEASRKNYLGILKSIEEHKLKPGEVGVYAATHYNLACLSALAGEKGPAVDSLRKAVEAGFRSREWIGRDRDLESLRGDAAYQKLMADDKLFEKKD